jgi:hypothetical protein
VALLAGGDQSAFGNGHGRGSFQTPSANPDLKIHPWPLTNKIQHDAARPELA